MLARREEMLYDSISKYTLERSSYETRVLTSTFEGFTPDGVEWGISEGKEGREEGRNEFEWECVSGGFIAIHIDLTKWRSEDILCLSLWPSEHTLEDIKSELEDLEFLLLFSLRSLFAKDNWILATQFLGFNIVSPPGNLVITFWAMPYPYHNSPKL